MNNKQNEQENSVNLPINAGHLTTETMKRLGLFFSENNHHPSDEMLEALGDLAFKMEEMALGIAEPKLFLSSLDPGVGKTQTLSKFVGVLLSSKIHREVGMLICVSRLTELERLVVDIGVPAESLAVLTSDESLNAMGKAAVNDAQVLITTQQMIESRLRGHSFTEAEDFQYLGKPRQVRLWDETFLPGETITLSAVDLGLLFKPLVSLSLPLYQEIKTILDEVEAAKDGSRYELPDFIQRHGIELNDVLGLFDDQGNKSAVTMKDEQQRAASCLWLLSGRTVSVRKDGKYGQTLIDYEDTLPEDLAPMVILDASGRCRDTYRDLERHRKSLKRLKTATKRYEPLRIHLWETGGGKTSWSENRTCLLDGVVKAINSKPDEPWLVVVHKKDSRLGDIEKDIQSLLTVPSNKVSFVSWGNHMATNEFRDIPNVILAGTLFYRPAYYEALKRLASGRKAVDGKISKSEIEKVTVGEHKHLILQALCRGTVRKCDGVSCHPMNAYIIASVRSGIKAALPEIFPGCQIAPWRPVKRTLRGKVKEAIDYLSTWMETNKSDFIKFNTVAKALSIKSPDFSKSIRQHSGFQEAIAEMGLIEYGTGVRMTGFLRGMSLFESG